MKNNAKYFLIFFVPFLIIYFILSYFRSEFTFYLWIFLLVCVALFLLFKNAESVSIILVIAFISLIASMFSLGGNPFINSVACETGENIEIRYDTTSPYSGTTVISAQHYCKSSDAMRKISMGKVIMINIMIHQIIGAFLSLIVLLINSMRKQFAVGVSKMSSDQTVKRKQITKTIIILVVFLLLVAYSFILFNSISAEFFNKNY